MTTDHRATILGTVTWPGGSPVATLYADGSWGVPGHRWMEGPLEVLYSSGYAGPQDGPFGARALAAAAASVGGTFDFPDRPGPPPGAVH